jgi:hypothetical protein
VTKDDIPSLLNNHDVHLRINSVKFEHHVNQVVISNNQPIKGTAVFHKNDGFPIKLVIESFLIISIECRHKVIDELKIPIESTIEWKIANGVEDGVFKHGYGPNTRYSDCDNDDCVIYYPPRDGIGKTQVKEIPIIIKIKANKKSREIIKNLPLDNSIGITSIGLCDYNACSFLLTLYLKQREGFLNKKIYEISFTVKKITKESKLEIYSNLKIITNNNNPCSSFIYGHQVRDNLKTTTSRKNVPKCIYCDLVMTVKQEYKPHSVKYKPKINIVTDRFFTSEYIKISKNQTNIKDIHTTTNECSTLFNIKINQKHIYKFSIINCPPVKTSQFFWMCTAGSFPSGDNGDSVIYHSPDEKELSKSPVILSLYEQDTSIDSNKDSPSCLSDRKKIWLLRRNIMGG